MKKNIINKIKSEFKIFNLKEKKKQLINQPNIENKLCANEELPKEVSEKNHELTKEERKRLFKKYGVCTSCSQPYTSEKLWCDNCHTKLFLEESKSIGCYKKFEELTREEIKSFKYDGICPDCKRMNIGKAWCNKCDPGRFLREGKTSGDSEMDRLIYEAQLETIHYAYNLEWVPFDRFKDIKRIGEGGFSKIYSAVWLDGIPKSTRIKSRTEPKIVVLKKIKNSKILTDVFINEIKIHYKCITSSYSDITQFYGITKEPETSEYMMILEYAEHGNIRDYLINNSSNLKWVRKLKILMNIAQNLSLIHELGYIHRDLHSGNILQMKYRDILIKITDLGLSQLFANSNSSSLNICGVLPYIAPEILGGKPYTFASDIYSLGIIMVEVATGKPPFKGVPHDRDLALAICNGLRPRVIEKTPKCYIDLVNRCLDADLQNRPSAKELQQIIISFHWQFTRALYLKEPTKIAIEFLDAIQTIDYQESFNISSHPEAIYTSRSFSFPNLPKPRNSIGVQVENPEVSDPDLIEQHICNYFQEFSNEDFNKDSNNKYSIIC